MSLFSETSTIVSLVISRLVDHQLPKYFKPEHVSEGARETCRNWMYKIASVRELLPRIYVEMAVLKSYSFLENT
jgi:hypothetical protein